MFINSCRSCHTSSLRRATLYRACLALCLLFAWHRRLSISLAPEEKVLFGTASDLQVYYISHILEILQRMIITFIKIIFVLLTMIIVAIIYINVL